MAEHQNCCKETLQALQILTSIRSSSWSCTSPVQHRFGSVSEHFLDQTQSVCSICSVVFVYFI